MHFQLKMVLPILALVLGLPSAWGQVASWPDLSSPARAIGGGEHDAAVVVGVEDYLRVPGVPGAKSNAKLWYQYLTETRGAPVQNVKLLINDDATREEILSATRKAASRVQPGGTLWFVFVGHGAPGVDGKDGVLVGVDAQQKADSLETRSVRREELLKELGQSKAGSVVVLLDACFSGRGQDGSEIISGLQPLVAIPTVGVRDSRVVVLTAARGNQYAGALPGAYRPAFSYLVLGGLRGWAGKGAKVAVTAGELLNYATNALEATLRGRAQTPELIGRADSVVGTSAAEEGPNLAKLAVLTAGRSSIEFKVSELPSVPKANAPTAAGLGGVPSVGAPKELGNVQGINFGTVDVDALEEYDAAVKFEKGSKSAESKAAKWRELGRRVKSYSEVAEKRAESWDAYASEAAFNILVEKDKDRQAPEVKRQAWLQLGEKYPRYSDIAKKRATEWEQYAKESAAVEQARIRRVEIRDKDWIKLRRLLSLSVVDDKDKKLFAETFVAAYGDKFADNPYLGALLPYLAAGRIPKGEIPLVNDRAKARMDRILLDLGCSIKNVSPERNQVTLGGETMRWENMGEATRVRMEKEVFVGMGAKDISNLVYFYFGESGAKN